MTEEEINKGRKFLKTSSLMKGGRLQFSSDQLKKIPSPPLQKPYPETATLIDLIQPEDFKIGKRVSWRAQQIISHRNRCSR